MRNLLILGLTLAISACSGGGSGSAGSIGSLNPFNWFKGSNNTETVTQRGLAPRRGYTVVTDTRGLVEQISDLKIERTPTGVIVRASGLPTSVGFYNAGLVPVAGAQAGERAYQFRIAPPTNAARLGTPRTREIQVAVFIPNSQLAGIRQIRVIGNRNERTARR